MNKVPSHKKLYGDNEFHLRPIFMSGDEYFFALRPSRTDGYLFELEGEFGIGEKGLKFERSCIKKGEYTNIRYVYYSEDVEDMSEMQKKKIIAWAIDGQL